MDALSGPDARIGALDPEDPELRAHSDVALDAILSDLGGAPSLDDYRRVYDTQGWDWPGEDEIRRRNPVASAG